MPRLRAVLVVAVAAGIGWLARRGTLTACLPVSRFVVDGASMEPAYRDGQRVLIRRLSASTPLAAGDVVVLRDPQRDRRFLLKRVAMRPHDGARQSVYVLGDNTAASRDSRAFGAVPRESIVGRAWRTY